MATVVSLHAPRPRHPAPPSHYLSLPPRAAAVRTPSPPAFPTTASHALLGRTSYELFVATRSRVLRIFNLPTEPACHLASLFVHPPLTLWALRQEYGGPAPGHEEAVWAVFASHSHAAAALGLSGAAVSVATALEADLEPFQKLRKLELRRNSTPSLSAAHRVTDLSRPADEHAFTLSSNPPNPRTAFRQGDWICPGLTCAAHNFMRNLVCIGCGCPRPVPGPANNHPWPRLASSPRFTAVPDLPDPHPSDPAPQRLLPKMPSLPSLSRDPSLTVPSSRRSFPSGLPYSFPAPSFPTQSSTPHFAPAANACSPTAFSPTAPSFSPTVPSFSPPSTSFPLPPASSVAAAAVALKLPSILTPTGRAFSIGGKVQNVSSDPLAPCVLYWPDNEPFPEQGQIRPPGNVGAQPPPILNTGNKGPIEQQPGDWVCAHCDYLNWRRRKVCQTCFPYAEGNTDGVSASVQAERISMLAQVLAASQPAQHLLAAQPQPAQLLVHAGASAIPTPPNDSLDYLYRSAPPPDAPLLPAFLAAPATPPLSLSSGSSSPQSVHGPPLRTSSSASSLALAGGPSIWALRKDEVDP